MSVKQKSVVLILSSQQTIAMHVKPMGKDATGADAENVTGRRTVVDENGG